MFKILIADRLAKPAVDFLKKQKDCRVVVQTGLSENELSRRIASYNALIVRAATQVTAKVIQAAKELKIIGRAGAGTDNIDKEAATAADILVLNAPTGNLVSVAELAIGHILAASRRLVAADQGTKQGVWPKKELGGLGRELAGKTVGIVGLGKIGQLVARRLRNFEVRILAFDPVTSEEVAEQVGAQLTDLRTLLKEAEIVTLHVPLNSKTRDLLDTPQFKLLAKSALVVNCARGGIINEKALINWLKRNPAAQAALDTFANEPVQKDNQLLALPNLFTTPHLGASTVEAQEKVGLELAEQVVRALRGEIVENVVNLPNQLGSPIVDQKSWNDLAEKLARLAAQILEKGALKKIELELSGEITAVEANSIQAAVLKGLLEVLSTEKNINFVNAREIAQQKDLELRTQEALRKTKFTSELGLKLMSDQQTVEVRGTVIEHEPRITFIEEFQTNFRPGKRLLLTRHRDYPGIIGRVGSLLGKNKVNVASMNLGRTKVGGEALMILDLDRAVPRQVLKEMRKWEDFERVLCVDL